MTKLKRLLCSLILVPCVLAGSACTKGKDKIDLEEYSKLVQDAGYNFYQNKFYPNDDSREVAVRPLTVTVTSNYVIEEMEDVEYNHVEGEGGMVSSSTETYLEKTEVETKEVISIQEKEDQTLYTANVIVKIERTEKVTVNGKRATEDDSATEKYTHVTETKEVITFVGGVETSKIYREFLETETDEEDISIKEVYTYTDSMDVRRDIFNFYDDMDEELFEGFFELNLDVVLLAGEIYKDGKTFGNRADYAVPSVSENYQGYSKYEIEYEFKNNLPHKMEMNVENIVGEKGSDTYGYDSMESEILVEYKADAVVAPEGYTETVNPIELEINGISY